MIPKAEGDSTPLGQRPLCVLPVVYRLWASVRLAHLEEWFHSWVPVLVEVFLRLMPGMPLPLTSKKFLATLVILIDRDILDCALGRLGLPAWFRRVYFSFHRDVRLRFKLAAGLGVAWKRAGGIPQG